MTYRNYAFSTGTRLELHTRFSAQAAAFMDGRAQSYMLSFNNYQA